MMFEVFQKGKTSSETADPFFAAVPCKVQKNIKN